MNKKILSLILIVLISFSFLSIVVADNAANDDGDATDDDNSIDDDTTDDASGDDETSDKDNSTDKNETSDKDNETDENETDDKPNKNYILAKGKGNNIKFSDGFRGFRLDYSKSPASPGDEFKHAPASAASNSNTLKLAIIECYKQDSVGSIGKIMADFVKKGSSNTPVGEAVMSSHEKIGDYEVVEMESIVEESEDSDGNESDDEAVENNNDTEELDDSDEYGTDDAENYITEGIFEFEVLKSVSGNESDYFAYKVHFARISYDEYQSDLIDAAGEAGIANATNITNDTNETMPGDNETNSTVLQDLYDFLAFAANALFDAWKPFIDTIMGYFLKFVNAIEDLVSLFETILDEIQSLVDALKELIKVLTLIWDGLDGLLKLLVIVLNAVGQFLNWLVSIVNLIVGLLYTVISLLQQLLGLVYGIINFFTGLLNQLSLLAQAFFDFLKATGNSLIKLIENASIFIIAFLLITIAALFYNK